MPNEVRKSLEVLLVQIESPGMVTALAEVISEGKYARLKIYRL